MRGVGSTLQLDERPDMHNNSPGATTFKSKHSSIVPVLFGRLEDNATVFPKIMCIPRSLQSKLEVINRNF